MKLKSWIKLVEIKIGFWTSSKLQSAFYPIYPHLPLPFPQTYMKGGWVFQYQDQTTWWLTTHTVLTGSILHHPHSLHRKKCYTNKYSKSQKCCPKSVLDNEPKTIETLHQSGLNVFGKTSFTRKGELNLVTLKQQRN